MNKSSTIAEENSEGKIEAPTLDKMIGYTAIKPGNKNNREQFIRDVERGFMLDNRNLVHLSENEIKQYIRNFLDVEEKDPEPIKDEIKALQLR